MVKQEDFHVHTELVVSVTSSTGIPIDTIYTAKTVWGMLTEMGTNPGRFRGNRVLFIHTGLQVVV